MRIGTTREVRHRPVRLEEGNFREKPKYTKSGKRLASTHMVVSDIQPAVQDCRTLSHQVSVSVHVLMISFGEMKFCKVAQTMKGARGLQLPKSGSHCNKGDKTDAEPDSSREGDIHNLHLTKEEAKYIVRVCVSGPSHI